MANKDKEKKLAIFRAWPWISNCWERDSNSGLSGIESSALTTRPSRLGANLRRDATSRLLFLDQSVLADFDPRKKKEPHFKTRSLSGTSNNAKYIAHSKRNKMQRTDGLCDKCFFFYSGGVARLFQMSKKLSFGSSPSIASFARSHSVGHFHARDASFEL